MELEKIVATNITELRKSKQWTQLELAEKLNYSDKSISKWERGDGMPDLKTLCKMAELFSVSIDFFVTEGAAEQMKKYN
ncbi:MAG: helix-turn-helix transcriptional regulator, partial [Eubacteriales bacterium]|nr:helix-turn-helix transcriptional regulator [Eubacteriales bacterium]